MIDVIHGDEMGLRDILNIFRRYKWLLLGLPIIGAILAALLVAVVLRPTWEASGVLEVGTVGPTIVEPVANVVTRIMLPSFPHATLNVMGIKPEEMKEVRGFLNTLKVAQIKGTELIEINLRGASQEMAKKLMQGVILSLQKTHSKMMAVTIERNKKQLQILSEDILKLEADNSFLKKKLLASHNWNAFDATLAATLLKDKSVELRNMVQAKLALEEQLSPSRTYTTRMIDEINITDGPVSPKTGLIIGLAILLGLFCAIIFAFIHNALTVRSPA